jgi:DNA-binding MarR family transcriptional regulator
MEMYFNLLFNGSDIIVIIKMLAEQLMNFGPTLHKKFHRALPLEGITKQQLFLLFTLYCENGKTMKYYGDKMMVSKSSITILVDKLIEEKFVIREENPEDRRESLLVITDSGKEFIEKQKEVYKEAIIKKLEVLSEEEIRKLNEAISVVTDIFSKME